MSGLDDIARDLAAAAIATAPPLESIYAPDRLPEVREEIAALEDELDVAWPGWRIRKPFHQVGRDLICFIKIRLKRLDLIRHGRRDWGIRLTEAGGKILAVPVRPAPLHSVQLVEIYDTPVSASILADRMSLDLDLVERTIAAIKGRGQKITRRALKLELRSAA